MHRDLTSFTRPGSDQMIWGGVGVTGVKGVGEGEGEREVARQVLQRDVHQPFTRQQLGLHLCAVVRTTLPFS